MFYFIKGRWNPPGAAILRHPKGPQLGLRMVPQPNASFKERVYHSGKESELHEHTGTNPSQVTLCAVCG